MYNVIYQPGKVASRSLNDSLKNSGYTEVIHAHRLNLKHFHLYLDVCKEESKPIKNEDIKNDNYLKKLQKRSKINSLKYLFFLYNFKRKFLNNNYPFNIITCVREPISRNISAFFQNYKIIDKDFLNKDVKELERIFFSRFNHINILYWWEYEFKKVFNFDLLEEANFNPEKGYSIIKKGNMNFLVLKVEYIDSIFSEAMSHIGIEASMSRKFNVSSSKIYKNLYNNFKGSVCFGEEYIDYLLNSRYARTFYSSSELDELKNKYFCS